MTKKNSKNKEKNTKTQKENDSKSNNSSENNKNTSNEGTSYNMSEEDIQSLNLLNMQIMAIEIGAVSSILSYKATIKGIQVILDKYNNVNKTLTPSPDTTVLKALYLSLTQNIISTNIAFTRYNTVYNQSLRGEFKYSLEPNKKINIANVLSLIATCYGIQAALEIFARENNQPVYGVPGRQSVYGT